MVGHGINETECNSSEAKEGVGSMELVSQVVVILPYGAGNEALLQELYIP